MSLFPSDATVGVKGYTSGCTGCPLCPTRNGFCPGAGPRNAALVVIGEAPGRDEIAHNPPLPFIGASGRILRQRLDPAVPTYITNVRKCLPPADETPDVRDASIAHCIDAYLQPEIDALDGPAAVYAVGGDAARTLGIPSILDAQGAVFTADEARAMIEAHAAKIP